MDDLFLSQEKTIELLECLSESCLSLSAIERWAIESAIVILKREASDA